MCSAGMRECFEHTPLEQSQEALQRLLSLRTKNEQDIFLQNLIKRSLPNRRRSKSSKPSTRSTNKYHIIIGGITKEVCRQAFMSTYGISIKRLKRLNKLAKLDESPKDKRGKSKKSNTISPQILLKIDNFVKSFPTEESHYSGKVMRYLDERLNVRALWEMYCEKHPDSKVGRSFFFRYFADNFDLKFGQPKVDCCCICETLRTKLKNSHISDAARKRTELELKQHQEEAAKFYRKLKSDAQNEDPTVAALCYDYMQNSSVPIIPVQESYYLRQVNVSIFCIHNMKDNTAKFYVYHEGQAKKSPDEVCSFLTDYVENELSDDIETLLLHADNCSAQNKNHSLSKLLAAWVERKKFKRIEQYFPIRGHSFLPCDRDFSMVKRKLKKIDRIYSVRRIMQAIIQSSHSSKFQVKLVTSHDIINHKEWWSQHYKKNVISVETRGRGVQKKDKVHFSISEYFHFVYSSEMVGTVVASVSIGGTSVHTFHIRKNTSLELPKELAYAEGYVQIKESKINDIKKLASYIPEQHLPFYNILINWPTKPDLGDEIDESA
ncbi:hypothetical protein QAD02_014184 [Eretmocerus hayati]|uniref:Uncharacterized protein n=2 Tax=Eretmocerus hayati TaxID=131215 RepID=A0ACC2P4R9_9HYME|nr:hypothetical protein QAD02_014184 [Eretmocerus hayati]